MNLTQLIESRKKAFWEIEPQEPESYETFLSESIRLAYIAGLQRSKELVPKKYLEAGVNPEGLRRKLIYNAGIDKTLSNIEDEIKSTN